MKFITILQGGGVFPIYYNITRGRGGSLGTPNLYYVIYGRPLKASRQCALFCEFAMHQKKWKWNCTVCSYVAVLLHASTSCAFLDYPREALVTFVCLLTSMCHLVFLQLMYVLVCKSYHIVIVLFAAMWLFFYMLPHHVLS